MTSRHTCLGLVVLAMVLAACGGVSGRAITSATADLPRYSPEEAALFDDAISAEIFGLELGSDDPSADPHLRRRVARAQSVVRAKISTVGGTAGDAQLTLRPFGKPLAGEVPPASMELSLSNPSSSYLHARGSVLVGQSLILFYRTFADQGRAQLHFHAEADTPEMRAAIEKARALSDLTR